MCFCVCPVCIPAGTHAWQSCLWFAFGTRGEEPERAAGGGDTSGSLNRRFFCLFFFWCYSRHQLLLWAARGRSVPFLCQGPGLPSRSGRDRSCREPPNRIPLSFQGFRHVRGRPRPRRRERRRRLAAVTDPVGYPAHAECETAGNCGHVAASSGATVTASWLSSSPSAREKAAEDHAGVVGSCSVRFGSDAAFAPPLPRLIGLSFARPIRLMTNLF